MSESLTTTTSSAAVIPTEGDNFELSAQNPVEMVQCHERAIQWCENKIKLVSGEANELCLAYKHARQKKWKSETLKRHWELALKRVMFYEKMLSAFKAGYYIVPNFPVTLFAIRTDKPTPKRMWARLKWSGAKNFEQEAKILPVGEGEYQNPQPVVTKDDWSKETDENESETWTFQATDWADMEFPANMARVHVMEAATRAMDQKIFDEVGFLPTDYKRNPDPLLIGRIIDPRPVGYGPNKRVSFILAWHIDTSNL